MKKQKHKLLSFLFLNLIMLLVVVGCGGGGSSSGGAGNANVAAYITDAPDSNDHVWVKIYKVTLDTATTSVTLMDDVNGRTVDLRALRDNAGRRFLLLDSKSIPAGTYTGATFTLDPSLTIFPAGSSTGEMRHFPQANANAQSMTDVKVTFATPVTVDPSSDHVIIDFDLANWNDDGNVVTPVLKHVEDNSLHDGTRHEAEDYHGVIGGLSGDSPNFAFNMATRSGGVIKVTTDSSTSIVNSDGSSSPVLANGAKVEVTGKFNFDSKSLAATSIKIEKGEVHNELAEAHGTPSEASVEAHNFKLTISRIEHFVPLNKVITVNTNDSTVFLNHAGAAITEAEFYVLLATSTDVEVKGAYSDGSIAATRVKIEDEHEGGGGNGDGGDNSIAEARGFSSDLNAETGTFKLQLREWFGFQSTQNTVVNVTLTSTARLRDNNGETITKAAFFELLATNTFAVKVEGTFAAGTLTAKSADIRRR